MLQHLIILLDDTATSFCHYNIPINKGKRPIDVDVLKEGIKYGMMENLMIHFVYPKDNLPLEYAKIINSIDHIDIKPYIEGKKNEADVVVFNDLITHIQENDSYKTAVIRLKKTDFFTFPSYLVRDMFKNVQKFNFIITDMESSGESEFNQYRNKLHYLSELIEKEYINGRSPQCNLLTDRMLLKSMNNCGAGDTTITLAPNGRFYICPAFYYDDMDDFVGDLKTGVNIINKQLYKLEYAPICCHCDAYQCRRCVWLNRKMTLEINTPSHEQCVAAHIERNASRTLMQKIRQHGEFLPDKEIKEINYLDPFENKEQWQQGN